MGAKLRQIGTGCLEGVCGRAERAGNRIKIGGGHPGIERLEAHLTGQAFSGRPLPFLADPIVEQRALPGDLPAALWRLEDPIEGFAAIEMISQLADLLGRAAGACPGKPASLRLASLLRLRDLIAADPA